MSDFTDKVRSIAVPRRLGQPEKRTEGNVTTTEHWDGRQDATVRPDVVRYGARVHGTGKRKGEVAEVAPMISKEKRERYGEG